MAVLGRGWTAVVAAGTARLTYRAIDEWDQRSGRRLVRTNYRGQPVTLSLGSALVMGSAAGLAIAPGLSSRQRAAGLVACLASGGLGLYDDVAGATSTKGLRGHLTALAHGEVTSGSVKIVGIGCTGVAAGLLARDRAASTLDRALAALLVAGTANVVNLFDLRPGRAAKVVLMLSSGSMLSAGPAGDLLAAPVGAVGSLLVDDLGERGMLGDTGANALGALVGTAGANALGRRGLATALGVVVGLTMVSERVSFSRIIDDQPVLSWIDALGRPAIP